VSAAAISRALGGHRAGRGYLVRCPVASHGRGEGDRSPSLHIEDGDKALLVHCYAGCDPRDVLEALRPLRLDDRPGPAPPPRKRSDNSGLALALWAEARHPDGSPVEPYLASRGLALPPEAAGAALRWHPDCPFGQGTRVGCMVALVRNVVTDQPQAIHRTAIDRDGRKLEHLGSKGRMSLGPTGGGAVKLTPDEDVELHVGIGEGLESTLSLRTMRGCERLAVWCLLSSDNMKRLPVLGGIESLCVAVDHEPTGILAAREVAARWQAAGREVLLFAPRERSADLNDLTKREAGHG
jgi:putative DNA primase/helicase